MNRPLIPLKILAFAAMAGLPACKTTQQKSSESTPGQSQRKSLELSEQDRSLRRQVTKDWFRPEPVAFVTDAASGKHEIARLMVSSCQSPAETGGATPFLSRWEIDLDTLLGRRVIRFTVSRYGMKVLVRGFVGEESTEFISQTGVPDGWMTSACAHISGSGPAPSVQANAEVADALKSWLSGFAPDCRAAFPDVSPEKQAKDAPGDKTLAWQCDFASPSAMTSEMSLQQTRQTMISGWTRQPYLLARRVAIGITLADALQEVSTGTSVMEAMKKPCVIIKRSLKPELPLVLDDPRIVDSLCGEGPDEIRKAIGAIVVAKIANEADSLRRVFENTSKLGALTVSFTQTESNGSPLLVTLRPEEDVVLGLAKFTQALLMERQNARREALRRRASVQPPDLAPGVASDVAADPAAVLGYACWNPLFDGSHERLLVAQELGLAAPAESCTGREGPGSGTISDLNWSPQKYVAESITSDTEFLVTNGETKTLRLPTGTYSYTVQVLQQAPSSPEDSAMPAAPIAEGKIEWTPPRPRPIISEASATQQNRDRP
ncbi:MAG: hypothetical protein RIQ81_871 [Pseudomonadota bacterium]